MSTVDAPEDLHITAGRIAVPVLVLLLWQVLASVAGEFTLAPPAASFAALVGGFTEGWMVPALRQTAVELVLAYGIAVVTGIWLGVTLGLNDFLNDVFEPLVVGVYSIPKVTLFPVFLMLFQLGTDMMVAFGWFHGIFPIAIVTLGSMATIRDEHLKLARSLGLSRLQTFREIIVPSILPGLVIGLRLGFNLTFLGVVLGEMFASSAGLGYALRNYITGDQTARMLAIIVVLVLVATAVNGLFFYIEGRLGAQDEHASMRA
ncbi:MAG: ABC transporter permease [Haloferacaceae archaeon]